MNDELNSMSELADEIRIGIQRLAQGLFEGCTDGSDFSFFLHLVEQFIGIPSDVLEQSINDEPFYDDLMWDTEAGRWI